MKALIHLILISAVFTSNIKSEIEIDLNKDYNFFTVPITFGDSQKFSVQIDTTTSETWVPSITTKVPNDPEAHRYNISESSFAEETNKTIEIDDEDGDVSGKSVCDALKIGDYTLDHFSFVQVNKYDDHFVDYAQGKLGLGLREDHGKNFNILSTLKDNELIEKRLFTIDPIQSALSIGSIPSEYMKKEYSSCNTTDTDDLDDDYRSGWVCELTHIFYNEEDVLFENGHGVHGRVIFDSAYQYISIPNSHLKLFKKEFIMPYLNGTCKETKHEGEDGDNDDEVYFICDNDEEILNKVNITFLIGGYGYILKKDTLFAKREGEDNKVELLIRFTKENDNIWSLGVPFVYNHVMVYDMDEKTVGFYYGEKIDLSANWTLWMNGELPSQKRQKMILLIVLTSLLGIILISIVSYMVYKACRKPRIESNGPLVQNEEKK